MDLLQFLAEKGGAELIHTVVILSLLHRLILKSLVEVYGKYLDSKIEIMKELAKDIALAAGSLEAIGKSLSKND